MRVVVSGASGFIGRHLARALRAEGAEVVALSRARAVDDAHEWHPAEIDSAEARRVATSGEVIVHLAALSDASASHQEPLLYNRVNALGTLNLLEAARANGAFFVLASSQRVYSPRPRPLGESAPTRPRDPYGFSKLIAEQWLRMYRHLYRLPAVALRFFSVYGPGQGRPRGTSGVVSIFLHRATAGEPLWVDGDKKGDFTYVEDVVSGIINAVDHRRRRLRPVYNIATGQGVAVAELAREVLAITGSQSEIVVTQPSGRCEDLVADISNARNDLGFAPRVALREGLTRTYAWLRA